MAKSTGKVCPKCKAGWDTATESGCPRGCVETDPKKRPWNGR